MAAALRGCAPLGDSAALVWVSGSVEAQLLAAEIRQRSWAGVEDVVPAADSVGIIVDPASAEPMALAERAARLPIRRSDLGAGRDHDVEVCFDGPDLEAVAAAVAMTPSAVVRRLEEAQLRVGWLGFMAGFGYLEGLGAPLDAMPRLARPRSRVNAGAFAIGGGMAGIYPFETPGGWNVVGHTGFRLFDPDSTPYATLAPGDRVRIHSVEGPQAPAVPDQPPVRCSGPRRAVVVEPGLLTTVQDAGRIGLAHLGVPRGGPADRLRHAIANSVVGNAERAAALEITLAGPELRFESATLLAVTGDAMVSIDGREMPAGVVLRVEPGNLVRVGRVQDGARAYLAVAGGLSAGRWFGSCSTDTVTPIPPVPLRAGDELLIGAPGRARGAFTAPPTSSHLHVQVTPGPDPACAPMLADLMSQTWTVGPESDRAGLRLERGVGQASAAGSPGESGSPGARSPVTPSRAVTTGVVQLPPDGGPIVLGPDHGTVGGYPVAAVVASSCLHLLGQALAGDQVTFGPDDGGRAPDASRMTRGWYPTASS